MILRQRRDSQSYFKLAFLTSVAMFADKQISTHGILVVKSLESGEENQKCHIVVLQLM